MPEMKKPTEMGAQTSQGNPGARGILKRMFAVGQGPVIGLVGLFVFLCLTTPAFLSVRNYLNIIDQITRNGIVALGMTFVIIIGGIDLSVGSTFVLAMMTCGVLTEDYNVAGQFAILGGILAAALGGLMNGLLVTKAKLPAFIATMAMMNVARGAANLISGLRQRYVFPAWFGDLATKNYFAALPAPLKYIGVFPLTTLLFFLLTILCWLFLSYKDTGRKLYAIGGNAEALSGLVIQQLRVKGAPAVTGFSATPLDMRTGTIVYGSPDERLTHSACCDLYHYYGLPVWGEAGCSDAKAIEAGASGLLKILFPDKQPNEEDFYRYCVNPAVELRQRIRDELCKLDREYVPKTITSHSPDEFQKTHQLPVYYAINDKTLLLPSMPGNPTRKDEPSDTIPEQRVPEPVETTISIEDGAMGYS